MKRIIKLFRKPEGILQWIIAIGTVGLTTFILSLLFAMYCYPRLVFHKGIPRSESYRIFWSENLFALLFITGFMKLAYIIGAVSGAFAKRIPAPIAGMNTAELTRGQEKSLKQLMGTKTGEYTFSELWFLLLDIKTELPPNYIQRYGESTSLLKIFFDMSLTYANGYSLKILNDNGYTYLSDEEKDTAFLNKISKLLEKHELLHLNDNFEGIHFYSLTESGTAFFATLKKISAISDILVLL